MLGDSGRSYVIGFDQSYPQGPHHRCMYVAYSYSYNTVKLILIFSSSCPSRLQTCNWDLYNSLQANPQLLIGALVGRT